MDGFWIAFGNTVNPQTAGAGAQALERPTGQVHRKIVLWRCLAWVWRMPGLPTQLPWRRFVCVLRKLGYTAQKGEAGSARSFVNPGRNPNVVSLREPHLGDNLGQAMLRKYLRKLLLDPNEFMHLLEDC